MSKIHVDEITNRLNNGAPSFPRGLSGGNAVLGIITATSFIGSGAELTDVGVGIQSGGTQIGSGITQFNFIGAGNTFAVNGNTVDISISGSGGGELDITSSLFI